MNNKSLIKKLVEAFDFGKLKPKNLSVLQSVTNASLLRMNDYNKELVKTVDLDLPSGTLWCKFNVGATNESETEYGDCFAWGETEPKDVYSQKTNKFKLKNRFTKYNKKDNLTLLLPEDDAATVNMGKYWRMPTKEQYQELLDNTTKKWIENYKGSRVNGILFTSKFNGNTLFFPAAGGYEGWNILYCRNYCCYYWSSTLDSSNIKTACRLYFYNGHTYLYYRTRNYGYAVRAVFNG